MDPDQMTLTEPADLDLHCFLNGINPVSAGQGLISTWIAAETRGFLYIPF